MIIGISIKKNNTYHYSKPFILNYYLNEQKEKMFCAQLMRDIDLTITFNKNDIIELDILKYDDINSYSYGNKKYKNSNSIFNKLGSYIVNFDNIINIINLPNFTKGNFIKKLDEEQNIEIKFTVIFQKNENNYILTTPSIKGYNIFLN